MTRGAQNVGRLLKTAMWLTEGLRRRSFDRASRNVQAVQERLLADILRRNQDTEYGRKHGFARISSPKAFAGAVPINAFADLSPYVKRMMKGEENILTQDRPVLFNLTSGTTADPKHVPITREGLALFARTSRQWLYRAMLDHQELVDHAIVCISGAAVEGRTESGIPYGSASGMIYESLPHVLRGAFALPFVLSGVKDHQLRYLLMARLALEREVSFIVTPNPTTLIKLAETGIAHQEEIIKSIREGTAPACCLAHKGSEDSVIVDMIINHLRPNPARAKMLEQVIRRHGKLIPHACWEKLRLVGCWLGGSVGIHADRLSPYFGNATPTRDIGYLASEAYMTIPYEDHTPAGVLTLDNSYYEFIPVTAEPAADKEALRAHELEQGKQYKIILTSVNGLYRYDIHDIIEVCGFYHAAPVIAFVRKGDDMMNITGEKLHVNHFIKAFQELKNICPVAVEQFRIIPDCAGLRYELLVRFDAEVTPVFLADAVLPLIDQSLAAANIEYKAKRDSGRLNPPCLHVMDESWAEEVKNSAVKSGRRDVQYKWRSIGTQFSAVDARHVQYTVTMRGAIDD